MVASNDSNPGVWDLAMNEFVALTNTFPFPNTYSVGDENGPVAFTTATFPIRVAAAIQGTDTLAITDNTTLDGQATFTLVYL